MTTSAGLDFREVKKEFGGKEKTLALDGVSFQAPPGEITVLVGPSGCGKSTLLHMAAGLIDVTGGEIAVNDKPITGPGPERGVVFQQFALFPWLTVSENIAFGLKHQGFEKADTNERVGKYLDMMGLARFAGHYPGQLSGGMKQRVALARAYAPGPQILLMDEPFGALDAQTRVVMQEELLKLWNRERTTILFVTHAVEEAVYLGGQVVVLSAHPGRVKEIVDIDAVADRLGWRERDMDDVVASTEFNDLRGEVWSLVRHEMSAANH